MADKNGNYLRNQQIRLTLPAGDGGLSADSITTDSVGTAVFDYQFTGYRGHAVVRLPVPNVDTIDVYISRSVLIPGPGGQGQYVLVDTTYAD